MDKKGHQREEYLSHLLYADDVVLISADTNDLERMLNELNEASLQIGIQMKINKTNVMQHTDYIIRVNNHQAENVEHHKIKVFDTCILPVMCYGADNWTRTNKNITKLRITQRTTDRAMMGISLREHKRNQRIRQTTKVTDVIEKTARVSRDILRVANQIGGTGEYSLEDPTMLKEVEGGRQYNTVVR